MMPFKRCKCQNLLFELFVRRFQNNYSQERICVDLPSQMYVLIKIVPLLEDFLSILLVDERNFLRHSIILERFINPTVRVSNG